jgi:1-acyl-sn-glycerol-3-phosphate acyltransferase
MMSSDQTAVLGQLVVAALYVLLAGVVAWAIHRSPHPPLSAVLSFVSQLWPRVIWRARVEGQISIPEGQGAVVVCNHTSAVDPWFVFLASERLVAWMVAAEYPKLPVMRWFFKRVRYIPVSRGGIDTAATKQAIRMAQEGDLVGIFPEGRINTTGALLLPGRPGPALVALKARVPIVPCYIFNAPRGESVLRTFLTPAKTRIVVGQPIDIAPFVAREQEEGVLVELTLRVLREIAMLAGQPDYTPRLAGRKWKSTAETTD